MQSARPILLTIVLAFAACHPAAEAPVTDAGFTSDQQFLGDGAGPADALVAAPDQASTPVDTSAELEKDLRYLREEEKLARDVYRTLYTKWKIYIFNNIPQSEQRHMDAVKGLLDARGFQDPVTDDTVGVFVDANLKKLYDDLVAQGSVSLVAALEVGATIEDLDIKDIEELTHRTTDPAVLAVYESLMCGSRNHLRGFIGQLGAQQGSYTPQFISQAEYDVIINGAKETCP